MSSGFETDGRESVPLPTWKAVGLTMLAVIALALSGCAYGRPAQEAAGSQVGGVGGIHFDHKPLNPSTHMLTVYVSPGLMETEASMAQRMLTFANEFAARTCPQRFDFMADPNPDNRTSGLTQRTKVYTFRCSAAS